MAEPQTFRSAFNGFNREDVVRHLEYLNSRHTAELNQLKLENEALRAELNILRDRPPIVPGNAGGLEALRQQVAALEEENAALKAAGQETAPQPDAVPQPTPVDRTAEELEVYRRAERVEREARERAAKVYTRANSALADASAKVDEAVTQINGMADQVACHLSSLQGLVSSSKEILHSAVESLSPIRPDGET